jgi:DNA-binding SARP family transcriptional activator
MDFRILGPLEALDEGRAVMLGGGKQRALLALFLLHRGETLSTDRLIDELWGERPPATAAKTVQVYISRLRKALAGGEGKGPTGMVVTREHGYELELDPELLDAHRFERLVAEGRRELAGGRPERAAAALERALSLWRGPPLADLAYEPFAQREIARLDDLRVTALEQLIEARLALGAHAEVVEQLETLIADHPYRERLRAQLMLALYRSDRQADALQAYQHARTTLVEELGIQPGERLRELERAILAQDPALAAPLEHEDGDAAPRGPAPHELPTGVVTFLLTDIEGSSALWEADPEGMAAALELHDELIARTVEADAGRLLKTKGEGDATVTVFPRASDAVAAAVDIQEALGAACWPAGLELRVRIALHTGEAHERAGDYFGPALNRAARLRALARGGATVLSRATAEIVHDRLPAEVELVELGRRQLRGLTRPENVFELRPIATQAAASPKTVAAERAATVAAVETARGALVGRGRELAELDAGLEDAFAARGRLFLLAGEPGIGKSRLADELSARARARGATVLGGRCWEAGGAPAYWPWVQALRPYLRDTDREALRAQLGEAGADVAAVLPEVRDLLPDLPPPTAVDSEGARFRLLESVASFLRNAASATPLALFLDDLHAGDAPSLLLLRFVAGQLAGAPILIVGSYRDTEVGPELAEALAELSREAAVLRLALKGLSESDTLRLLELTMGHVPAGELAAEVQSETQGNPLFATEIGRLLASEGSRAAVPGKLPIPDGVREAIGQRLQRQSERCRQVLALASVVGREFDPDLLERVSGLEEDELFAALEEAATARLVGGVPESSGRLRFSHILVRDALYEELSSPRRLRLHRAVAEALEALYARNLEPHLAELAHHYLEAGTALAAKAIEYAQRAGDRAASQHGYEEAARHYASALRVLDATGSGDADRACELLLSFGEVQSRAGSGQEAKRALQRAATLAGQAGRSDQLARAALEYGGRFAWARASTDPALVPLLERALAAVGEQDSRTRVVLLARLAAAQRDDPGRERRVRLAEQAVEIARRIGDPVTLAAALEGQWIAVEGPEALSRGDGIAQGERLIALGEQIGDKERVFAGRDYRLHCFWMLGDRAGVEVELEALGVLADELRQPAQRWELGTVRTELALMEGQFERAERLISETLALGQRSTSWNADVSERLALFVLRRAQGRLAELEDTIGRSTHEYPALLRFRCALAHLYAELGREGDARAAFDSLLSRDLGQEHLDTEWFFSMSLLPDPCAFLGDEDAAANLYSLLLPYEHVYALATIEAVFGSLARGLGVLATTLHRFDDAERHFEVAMQTERRMRARPWLAHAQHDLAAMLLTRGEADDRERAHALLEEAAATYRELGMPTWASRATALA